MSCSNKVAAPRGGYFYFQKLLLCIIAVIVGIVYWPGLSGPFILDDNNLRIISNIGGVNDFNGLWRYLTSGLPGFLGRPIPNLTFLANYSSWPTSPFPFKATNLTIHIITGGLLYLFTITLLSTKQLTPHIKWTALIVATYWLLNPLNVSTTLYVIQRMAMLSALFVIAGLALYIHGRKLQAEDSQSGYKWMSAAIILGTSLSVLCKENGALLPLLALVIEYTVIRHYLKLPTPNKLWTLCFLWLPTVTVLLLLAYYGAPHSYNGRGFTLFERLLTEHRVLIEYLYYWFNPFAVSRGVLASDYSISTNLITPWQTLPAILVVVGSVIWALLQRKRHPIAALTILFFFAGHLMESTIIPLEIYFEHRNYLPAILLILPLAIQLNKAHTTISKRLIPVLIVTILCTQSYQTFRLSGTWGNELKLASWWSFHNPTDTRAQGYYANTLSSNGRPDLALQVILKAILLKPEFSHYYLLALLEECKIMAIPPEHISILQKRLSRFPLHKNSYSVLKDILDLAESKKCEGFTSAETLTLISTLVNHPKSRKDKDGYAKLMHIYGIALLLDKQPEKAINSFKQSLEISHNIRTGLEQVALLGTHQYYKLGLSWLNHIAKIPHPKLMSEIGRSWDFDVEISRLRTQLNNDLAKSTKQQYKE